jgi:hypothetical protein
MLKGHIQSSGKFRFKVSSSKFVKKEDLPTVRKQLKNYERMKLLMERWIDLATELSNLRLIKETG